jgi:hypothetical protein
MLLIVDNKITLKGTAGVRIFKNKQEAKEYTPGDSLDFLLK